MLKRIREVDGKAYVIMITAFDDMKTTVEAMKLGAFEYICKPIDYDVLLLSIRKAQRMQEMDKKLDYIVTEASHEWSIDNIVGRTTEMRDVFKTIGMLSRSTTTVLIRGGIGNGQGVGHPRHPLQLGQPRRAVRRGELYGARGRGSRKRALRPRARRVHRGRTRQPR